MDSSAIREIAELARRADGTRCLLGHTPAIILQTREGEKVESVERLQAGRARFRGTYATTSLSSFTDHVVGTLGQNGEDFGPIPCFVNEQRMSAEAFFNLGTAEAPGHADWRAKLSLQPTAAFTALQGIDGKQLSQKAAAEFLEDWSEFIAPAYPDSGSEPGDGSLLKRAVQAVRKLKIKASAESVHEDKDLRSSRSAMEEIEASLDDNDLPEGFTFVCEPFLDLPQRPFRLGISIITGEKPSIVLRWKRREANEEAIARDFQRALASRLGDSASISLGEFNPGTS